MNQIMPQHTMPDDPTSPFEYDQEDTLPAPLQEVATARKRPKPGERRIQILQTLAAMLELGSPYAMRIAWGEYLLTEAVARGFARPLITGGKAPQG